MLVCALNIFSHAKVHLDRDPLASVAQLRAVHLRKRGGGGGLGACVNDEVLGIKY